MTGGSFEQDGCAKPSLATHRALVTFASAVLSAACASAEARAVHHDLTLLSGVAAPSMPRLCRAGAPTQWRWLVFSTAHCASCRRWMRELTAERQSLDARGIGITEVFVDGVECPQAIREANALDVQSVAIASEREKLRWNVVDLPTTYVVGGGKVVAVLRGRGPVGHLLAAQQQSGAGVP